MDFISPHKYDVHIEVKMRPDGVNYIHDLRALTQLLYKPLVDDWKAKNASQRLKMSAPDQPSSSGMRSPKSGNLRKPASSGRALGPDFVRYLEQKYSSIGDGKFDVADAIRAPGKRSGVEDDAAEVEGEGDGVEDAGDEGDANSVEDAARSGGGGDDNMYSAQDGFIDDEELDMAIEREQQAQNAVSLFEGFFVNVRPVTDAIATVRRELEESERLREANASNQKDAVQRKKKQTSDDGDFQTDTKELKQKRKRKHGEAVGEKDAVPVKTKKARKEGKSNSNMQGGGKSKDLTEAHGKRVNSTEDSVNTSAAKSSDAGSSQGSKKKAKKRQSTDQEPMDGHLDATSLLDEASTNSCATGTPTGTGNPTVKKRRPNIKVISVEDGVADMIAKKKLNEQDGDHLKLAQLLTELDNIRQQFEGAEPVDGGEDASETKPKKGKRAAIGHKLNELFELKMEFDPSEWESIEKASGVKTPTLKKTLKLQNLRALQSATSKELESQWAKIEACQGEEDLFSLVRHYVQLNYWIIVCTARLNSTPSNKSKNDGTNAKPAPSQQELILQGTLSGLAKLQIDLLSKEKLKQFGTDVKKIVGRFKSVAKGSQSSSSQTAAEQAKSAPNSGKKEPKKKQKTAKLPEGTGGKKPVASPKKKGKEDSAPDAGHETTDSNGEDSSKDASVAKPKENKTKEKKNTESDKQNISMANEAIDVDIDEETSDESNSDIVVVEDEIAGV